MIESIYDLYDDEKLDLYLQQINKPELKDYIKEIINSPLTIDNINKILTANANIEWNKEKKSKAYLYNDNFRKTIRFLKAETKFEKAIFCLNYYLDYKSIVDEKKFASFNKLLLDIHNQIHNNHNISQISKEHLSLYLKMYNIISKENFIKERTNPDRYKNIFIINPRSDAIKKEQEKQKRLKLLNLYKENNIKIINELNKIKENYLNNYNNDKKSNHQLELIINDFINQIIEMKAKNTTDIIKENDENYLYLNYIFKKIRRDIMKLAFTLEDVDVQLNNKDNIIFNDNNYIFNKEQLKNISIEKLNKIINNLSNINDNNKELLINNGLIMFYLLSNDNIELSRLLQNINDIENYCININIDNLSYILELNNLIEKGSIYLSMLGCNILEKTQHNTSYTYEKFDRIIKVLCDIVKAKYKKDSSTIPYIKGKYDNLFYSVYDNIENDVLTCGIDTNTCLKATGTENDFFHYTILSKNGINLKIHDQNGKLIARVSGNRHGNGLYFNQLRIANNTIISEDKIIEVFKQACNDIIEQSKDVEKIEFVIITKSYLTKDLPSNINEDLSYYIAINSIDNKSADWQEFIKNDNLEESYHGTLINDYGITDLICIKSIIGDLTKDKIKFYPAKDLYKRKRNKLTISKANNQYEQKINRIKSINCYEQNIEYHYQKTNSNQFIIIGDNWYILFADNIIDSCYLKNDKNAYIEYSISLNYLNELLNKKNIIKKKTITFS